MIYTQSHTPETCSYTHSTDTSKCLVHLHSELHVNIVCDLPTQIGLRAQHIGYKNCQTHLAKLSKTMSQINAKQNETNINEFAIIVSTIENTKEIK